MPAAHLRRDMKKRGIHTDETLCQKLGSISHNASAIPMPASAMKRSTSNSNFQQAPHTTHHVRTTSGSRMSLAPGRPSQPNFQRSSSGENLVNLGFSTVQRPSTANFLTSTVGRKSFAPVAMTPARTSHQQPQESAQRRSSVYSARPSAAFGPAARQSFFTTAPPHNGIPADPRRLRDPNTRAQMAQDLTEFLTQRNFEMEMKHTLTHKTMTNPTNKDFTLMFQFLYHCIDPAYRFQKGIDAEAPPLLKQLRYPFEKNISKSQLAAAGGGQNWPTYLGLLHWMMQLSKMMEYFSTGAYDEACVEAGYDVAADRITFQFLSDAYREWLSIEDDDEDDEEAQKRIQPHVQAMAAKFEQANQYNLEQVKQLEEESKGLKDQIEELSKSAPRLAKLDETIKVLEEDRVKFENYNQSLEAKIEKYQHRAELLQHEIEKCDQEMRDAEGVRDELQRKIDDQGISLQDIDRINTEHARLQKGNDTTSARLDETKERVSQKEADAGAKLDELESTVQRFNGLAYQIGITPSTAQNARGHDFELSLKLNQGPDFTTSQLGISTSQKLEGDRLLADPTSGYQPYHLLEADLKVAKKELQDLRKEISERRNGSLEDHMSKMDMLDKTKEALDDKYAEMDALGHRMRAAQEEFEKTKEITNAQNMASDTQIEKMEKELAKMRAGLTESVQLMEQREMNTNLE